MLRKGPSLLEIALYACVPEDKVAPLVAALAASCGDSSFGQQQNLNRYWCFYKRANPNDNESTLKAGNDWQVCASHDLKEEKSTPNQGVASMVTVAAAKLSKSKGELSRGPAQSSHPRIQTMSVAAQRQSQEQTSQPKWILNFFGPLHDPHSNSETISCSVRECIQTPVDQSYLSSLVFLNFSFDYELIQKGYTFYDRRENIELKVYQYYRLSRVHDYSSATRLRSFSWMVEAAIIAENTGLARAQERLLLYTKRFAQLVSFAKYEIPVGGIEKEPVPVVPVQSKKDGHGHRPDLRPSSSSSGLYKSRPVQGSSHARLRQAPSNSRMNGLSHSQHSQQGRR